MRPLTVDATKFEDLERFSESYKSCIFRGQKNSKWMLETSLERASRRLNVSKITYEQFIWREFRRHAHSYLPRVPAKTQTLEWLALMQHYGAPTRLLDFTYSFWTALFFAVEDAESDCAVIALNPSSLAKNNHGVGYNKILRENIRNGSYTDNYLHTKVPFYTNERLAIQKGTFIFSLNLNKTFNQLMQQNNKAVLKLIVDSKLFPEIRKKLNDFNCNSRVLFPGIDGYARYFKNSTPTIQ